MYINFIFYGTVDGLWCWFKQRRLTWGCKDTLMNNGCLFCTNQLSSLWFNVNQLVFITRNRDLYQPRANVLSKFSPILITSILNTNECLVIGKIVVYLKDKRQKIQMSNNLLGVVVGVLCEWAFLPIDTPQFHI